MRKMWVAGVVLMLVAGMQDPDAELQRVSDELQAEVAEYTGVTLNQSIRTINQSREEFGEFLRAQMEEEMTDEQANSYTLTFRILGLVPEEYDLIEGLAEAYETQAGAYYDPEDKTVRVLQEGLDEQTMSWMLFHELVHAVQDQEADLGALMARLGELQDEDQMRAAQFLWEGEAQMYTTLFQLDGMGTGQQMAGMALRMQAGMSREGLIRQARMAAQMGMLPPEMEDQMQVLEDMPDIIFHTMVAPYLKGAYAIHVVYEESGAEGVRALYTNLPPSTRVMLYPDLLTQEGGPPRPHRVQIPDLGATQQETGWTRPLSNVFGAIVLKAMFESRGRVSDTIARGWDGDRYELWTNGASSFLIWAIHFDTEEAAGAFVTQYEAHFREDSTGEITEVTPDPLHLRRADETAGREVVLTRDGLTVTLVQGNAEPPAAMLESLQAVQVLDPQGD